MHTTLVTCTLTLLLLSHTLGQASPLPADRTRAYATCAAYYETLFDSLVWFVSHPHNILRRRRQGVAIDALRALLQDDTTVITRRIHAEQDQLAFELEETIESYEALVRQYEGPCTALLTGPRPQRDWAVLLFGAKATQAASTPPGTTPVSPPRPIPPSRQVTQLATCAAFYTTQLGARDLLAYREVDHLQRRWGVAWRGVAARVGHDAASRLITAKEGALALQFDGTQQSMRALTLQHDAACTAVLRPLTEQE